MVKQAVNYKRGTAVFAELSGLEPKPKVDVSRRQLVKENRRYIRSALKANYSFEEISELLGLKGVEISASTLKHYYYESRPKSRSKKNSVTRPIKSKVKPLNSQPVSPSRKEDDRAKLLSMKTGPHVVIGELVDSV